MFRPPVHQGLAEKSLFPVKPDKKPSLPWKEYSQRIPTQEEYDQWSTHRGPWAMACGPVSGVIVLDFDGPEGLETLARLRNAGKLPETWEYTTPNGGVHLSYQYPNGHKITNGVRVMPGVDIRAIGGYVVVPSSFPDGRKWIIEPNNPPAKLPGWVFGVKPKETPVTGAQIVDGFPRSAKKGERNNRAASVAGRYMRQGNTAEETFSLLCTWNKGNTPPLSNSELRTVVDSISTREALSGRAPMRVIPATELIATETGETEMLISPFFPMGGKAILAAHGGTGKTLLAMNIAVSVANDLSLFQRWEIPTPGRVLYIDAESSRSLLKHRIEKISKGMRGSLSGIRLSFPPSKLDLGKQHIREAICKEVEANDVKLVVFDSFLCFTNMRNENDNTEVRDYLERVGEITKVTGTSVLVIDHAGKATAEKYRAGIKTQPRGASAKRDWADLVMILEERKHESKTLRTLGFDKTRFCATPPYMALEMDYNYVFTPSGEDELCPVTTIKQVVGDNPGITTEELARRLKNTTGCSIRTAYRGLARARELNEIEERQDGRKKLNYLRRVMSKQLPWEDEQ
jgi:hypothetical protein